MRAFEKLAKLLLAGLAREWTGFAVAVVFALLGGCALLFIHPVIGWIFVGLSIPLAIGALRHIAVVTLARRNFPPPGKLVDVGGFRLHVWAEGEAGGKPTVVWFPGGHDAGSGLYHLHAALRNETRSVLVDRPGTGWSDVGPFPCTTAREAQQVVTALERAGETPPFVLVGHSFGGYLAANIARRWPHLVSVLVLFDATPPDTIAYGPYNPLVAGMQRGYARFALLRLFGLHGGEKESNDPHTQALIQLVAKQLEPVQAARDALSKRSGVAAVAASIYGELTPEGMARGAWDNAVYEGDLVDLPVLLVAPGDLLEFSRVSDLVEDAVGKDSNPGETEARLRRFYARSRERYMTTSSRSQRIVTPPGTTHNFPYEAPEFAADTVRRALDIR